MLLLDLNMEVVGEAADWTTTLALATETRPDMVLVDWELISRDSGNTLIQLRAACPVSAGADAFISKGEMPDRIADRLRAAAERVRTV
jgi:DNA-binding NarL/FixJ family response regulator